MTTLAKSHNLSREDVIDALRKSGVRDVREHFKDDVVPTVFKECGVDLKWRYTDEEMDAMTPEEMRLALSGVCGIFEKEHAFLRSSRQENTRLKQEVNRLRTRLSAPLSMRRPPISKG
ncbi:hypothetical protein C0431_12535 [bacterium]|nr:hypothetical protein [bacterium]